MIEDLTPERLARNLWACLLIDKAKKDGLIEGPFKVETDRCQADLALLAVTEGLTRPDDTDAVAWAISLMNVGGGIEEEDRFNMAELLSRIVGGLDWPA